MKLKKLLFISLVFLQAAAFGNSGIWDRFIILNYGSTNFISGSNFNNQNLGTFPNTANYLFKGGQIKTYKNGGDDITGATMFYRVKLNGTTGGAYTSLNLPFNSNLTNPGDQLWEDASQSVLFMQGLANGYYDLEVYFESPFSYTGGTGTHIDNNSGYNYVAHFYINSNLGCAFSLGNDTIVCGSGPLTLQGPTTAGTTYSWSNGTNNQTTSVNLNGNYSLTTNNNGCSFTDSIHVEFLPQQTFSLGADVSSCGAAGANLNSGYSLAFYDDTVTIIYDATQGVSQLVGASRVYFHSSIKLTNNTTFNNPWIGNWGQDDGIGLMDSLGNNLWRIKFNPKIYYGLTGNFQIDSLVFVFRNSDGSLQGKDNNGNDIKADYGNGNQYIHSNFAGVSFTKKSGTANSIVWNTGATSSTLNVTSSGNYFVDITTICGYHYHDTIHVTQGNIPIVSAGQSQAVCPGGSATFNATSGFANYSWSNGANTQSINVNTAGDYFVTVTDASGCTAIDMVNLTITTEPTTFITTLQNNYTITFTANCNMANASYQWDFNNDGVIDSQAGPIVSHDYQQNGFYYCKLITTVACGDDTVQKSFNINVISGIEEASFFNFEVYPNPFNTKITVIFKDNTSNNKIEIINCIGDVVKTASPSKNNFEIETIDLPSGVYFLKIKLENGKTQTRKMIKI